MLRGRRFVHLPVSFGCFEPLNGDNVEKFNSRRIEYFRTKSRPDSFMANEFFGVSSVRCAVHFADDRLHCREVPEPPVMTTVFLAMMSLLRAMKTVVGEKRTVKGKKFRFFVIFFNNQKKSGSAMCRKHMRSRSALFGFVRFLFLFYEFATAFNEFFF